jgi:hypothetical protein
MSDVKIENIMNSYGDSKNEKYFKESYEAYKKFKTLYKYSYISKSEDYEIYNLLFVF